MCDSCKKREKKCFWRMEARWDKACLACHGLKKSCVTGRAEELEMEAGPSKKVKVEEKGKGKAKVKVGTPVSRVTESVTVHVLRDILKELKGLRAEVCDLCAFSQNSVTLSELSWRTLRQTNSHVSELLDHFVPVENDGEGSRVENEEGGGDRVENGEVCDVEMEENGADMVDDAMDETLW